MIDFLIKYNCPICKNIIPYYHFDEHDYDFELISDTVYIKYRTLCPVCEGEITLIQEYKYGDAYLRRE